MPDGSGQFHGSRTQRRRLAAQTRQRERRLTGRGDARTASARLILDPLEPRVLLNADTLAVQVASVSDQSHADDLLVRMINNTVTVGTQTQTVQRVQMVDQTTGGAILAMGDLAEISAVAIGVTAGADRITLDLDSFGANMVPELSVQGDGLTALAIDHAAWSIDWRLNGDGSGNAGGAGVSVRFTGIAALAGGDSTDVLHGPAPDNHLAGRRPRIGQPCDRCGWSGHDLPGIRCTGGRSEQPGHVRHTARRRAAGRC